MAEREELLTAVQARLLHAEDVEELSLLLEPTALAEAEHLTQLLDDQDVEGRCVLGWLHWYRFQALPEGQDQEDLNTAVAMFTYCFVHDIADEALPELLLPDLADRAVATAVKMLQQILGPAEPAVVTATVRMWQHILTHTPSDHPKRAERLSNLGGALRVRFIRSGAVADLDDAIDAGRKAVQATPTNDPDRAVMLSNLRGALQARFERSGAVADLDDAIDAGRKAVQATSTDHPDRAGHLNNLEGALLVRFIRFGAVADLDDAIDAGRKAVQATSTDHPDRAGRLSNLGLSLQARFDRSGALADLEDAIDAGRKALLATPTDHPERTAMLSNLALALKARFERSGALADIEDAIEAGRQAVHATPTDQPGRAAMLSRLGVALLVRFKRSGALADLEDAIDACRQAVQATPNGHPDRAGYLSNLGIAQRIRFEQSGALADLDEAIDIGRQAVQATPTDDPSRAGHLNKLGGALLVRFIRSGALADLENAIDACRQALRSSDTDAPDRAAILSNLGSALLVRFERSGSAADLEDAVDACRQAVQATRIGHRDRAGYLSNLEGALRARFIRSGALADLEDAIDAGWQAVQATPTDHPNRAAMLSNLGGALHARFERSGAAADLDDAIDASRQAVQAIPMDHPNRAGMLRNLGVGLQTRYERSGAPADLDEAGQALAMAAEVGSAAPSERIRAGRAAAGLLVTSDPGRAAELLEGAVRLLPEVAPRGLERPDQQELLGGLAGVAGDAAALVLADLSVPMSERAGRALGLLESGRALLLAQVMATRGDLTDLRTLDPAMAERFTELRDLLDQPQSSTTWRTRTDTRSAPDQAREARDRRRVAAELGVLLEQIRGLEGFASFALPPTVQDLRGQAGHGPIATFNVNDYRSDALLLTKQGVTAVALPDLTPAAVVDRIEAFHQALTDSSDPDPGADRGAAQRRIREILAWLWDTAVGPVLDTLGYAGPPSDPEHCPRVWWAPGGLLSLLPLHAAGHHTARHDPGYQTRTVVDRVVSSYTPTIGALSYARQHTAQPSVQAQTLIVAMPSTPGLEQQGRLSAVAREAALLQARLPRPTLLTEPETGTAKTGDQIPTRKVVFARLAEVTIAHFACHGFSHPTDPSQSLLLLHDWQKDPLTVASLSPVNLDHARLAYLSACSTALTQNPQLLDESIHLTAAFQLAGFPHVIGTLWEINDEYAADIADTFYTRLTDSKKNVDTGQAAQALHDTIRGLRDKLPLTPSLWAAHLHAGA